MHRIRSLAVLLCALSTGACGDRPPAETTPQTAAADDATRLRDMRFAPELNVDFDRMLPTHEGVYYEDIRQGSGRTAEPGHAVTVEYRAWLPDGTLFEQRPSPEGFGLSEFVLGVSPPVPGLTVGMTGMRVGGVRRIVIPGEHAYGLVGRPEGVAAESPVVFEVRLVGLKTP